MAKNKKIFVEYNTIDNEVYENNKMRIALNAPKYDKYKELFLYELFYHDFLEEKIRNMLSKNFNNYQFYDSFLIELTNEQFKEDLNMKTFKMNDLHKLVEIIGSSSASDDRLPAFLAKFDFPDKYETDDDSIVFVTGNDEQLEIEFFDIDSVYNRTISVLYRETPESRFTVLEWEDLKKIY